MDRSVEIQVMLWSDVSIIALESLMTISGDTNSLQYLNVKERALSIIGRMKSAGFGKEKMQEAVSLFLETRSEFVSDPNSSSIPEHQIPSVLVALCVRKVVPFEIEGDAFEEIAMKSHEYLSGIGM
jgi:hypothetical protein